MLMTSLPPDVRKQALSTIPAGSYFRAPQYSDFLYLRVETYAPVNHPIMGRPITAILVEDGAFCVPPLESMVIRCDRDGTPLDYRP